MLGVPWWDPPQLLDSLVALPAASSTMSMPGLWLLAQHLESEVVRGGREALGASWQAPCTETCSTATAPAGDPLPSSAGSTGCPSTDGSSSACVRGYGTWASLFLGPAVPPVVTDVASSQPTKEAKRVLILA